MAPVTKWLFSIFSIFTLLPAFYSCAGKKQETKNIAPAQSGQIDVASSFGLDKSPMDMCYFPVDYPIKKMAGNIKEPPIARLIYSRPRKAGRPIFGEVVKFGAPWRLGANEATEIEFFSTVTIQGKKVAAGRYVIYCIPAEQSWKIVLNRDLFTWGLKINPALDAYSFEVPTNTTPTPIEVFTMDFQKIDEGFSIIIGWDNTRVALPVAV